MRSEVMDILLYRAANSWLVDRECYHIVSKQKNRRPPYRRTPTVKIDWLAIASVLASVTLTVLKQSLGQRLKQISLRAIPLEAILDDIAKYRSSYIDVLGFRLCFDDYPVEYPDYFRVVDLRNGKKIDDGYRAIHLYYQRDNLAYPIEVQLWCGRDYTFNIWSHQYVYKYKKPEIGKILYREYSLGDIRTEQKFLARLQELEAI